MRNANRPRRYKKDIDISYFHIEARRKLTEKQYLLRVYEQNKEHFDAYYQKMLNRYDVSTARGRQGLASFQESAPTSFSFFRRMVKVTANREEISFQKAVRAAIEGLYLSKAIHYRDNFLKGLKSKFPTQYQQILDISGDEAIDPNKITYRGDGIYIYKGTEATVQIDIHNSPESCDVREAQGE